MPPRTRAQNTEAEGWTGWDEYAPFYDWENARTVARRDVPFWQRLAAAQDGRVLELGCGTGRITLPVLKTLRLRSGQAGAQVVGVDRSAPMLARARHRLRRLAGARERGSCPCGAPAGGLEPPRLADAGLRRKS